MQTFEQQFNVDKCNQRDVSYSGHIKSASFCRFTGKHRYVNPGHAE